jgi:hypothetical protein
LRFYGDGNYVQKDPGGSIVRFSLVKITSEIVKAERQRASLWEIKIKNSH